MKKIFQLTSLVVMLCALAFSCAKSELSTEQYDSAVVALKAYGPQPVVRGGTLRFVGSNLDQVVTVTIPGVDPITPTVVTSGTHSEIRVTVPKDGPEPGYPVLTLADGNTIVAKTEITYSEPISIDEFTEKAYPGEKLTIDGDYLNLIHEVVFTKNVIVSEDDFDTHTRYQIVVTVPAEAQTGILALGTLDETKVPAMKLKDEEEEALLKTLNLVETETEFEVGTAEGELQQTTGKSDDILSVKGDHLELAASVKMEGAQVSELEVSDDVLRFWLPSSALDGEVLLVMASGVEVPVGTLTKVKPVVAATSPAPAMPGAQITLTGSDLDLVVGVETPSVSKEDWPEFDGDANNLVFTLPADVKVGDIILHVDNGTTINVAYTLTKPVITSVSDNPILAGDPIIIQGENLSLVTSILLNETEMEFVLDSDTQISVATTRQNLGGKLVLVTANGTEVAAPEDVEFEYGNLTSVESLPATAVPGEEITMTGSGFNWIESIYFGDFKVTSYAKRTDTEMVFLVPSTLEAGDYGLTFVLTTGEKEEAVGWIISYNPDPNLYKTLWEGNIDITWGDGGRVIVPAASLADAVPGGKLRLYYTQKDGIWSQAQINYGDWTGINFTEEGISQTLVPTDLYGWFSDGILDRCTSLTLTQEILDNIQAKAGDCEDQTGCGIIIQGSDLIFTKVEYFEDRTIGEIVWEGETDITWGDGGRVIIPAASFEGVSAGSKLNLYYTQKDGIWSQAQINYGDWTGINFTEEGISQTLVPTDLYGWFSDGILDRCTSLTLTQEILDNIQAKAGDCEGQTGCGIIIQGSDLIFTMVTIK